MWTSAIFCGTTALFLSMTLAALWHLRWMRRLPALEALANATAPVLSSPSARIRCSVVIAARNEETRIEGTVRRLMAQREVEAEFFIVDDRSTDGTSEVLRQLAKEDARVKLQRVDVLPDGWLGKCHACHVGAGAATGDWILFTDADCWLKPDVIARAVRLAEREGADHVMISPRLNPQSTATRGWQLLFLMSISHWFSGVNRDRPRSYMGCGAFNLVRAAAYRQCGGYEALRLTVLDDVKLGQLLVRAGKRTRAFLGAEDVQCDWGTTFRNIVKLLEKNFFAALDFRTEFVLGASVAAILISAVIVLGLVSATTAGFVAALSPLTLILPASVLARRVGWAWPCAVFVPFMMPLDLYAMVNSTWRTLRQGGVRWRDTFYSLETLRARTVR
jgi:cellulose synthase/poly-beta-1,6-N-acetylglucosamine synthase-like glycosyltransferase